MQRLPNLRHDVGDQRRVVRDGNNGLVIPPGSPAALAAALERLADPQLRRRLGRAARHDAETRLSWEGLGEILQEFLAGIAAGRSALPESGVGG
ncbi:MAG: glycosyltransferase [Thermoanaerobaculia bacterium]